MDFGSMKMMLWVTILFNVCIFAYAWTSPIIKGVRLSSGIRSLVMMPTLIVQTSASIPAGDKRSQLLQEASTVVANELHKPLDYVMVSLKQSDAIMFAGNDQEPAAFCNLVSIGGIKPETNKKLSKGICFVLEKYLKVPSNRVYIQFSDSQASNFGFDGSTF